MSKNPKKVDGKTRISGATPKIKDPQTPSAVPGDVAFGWFQWLRETHGVPYAVTATTSGFRPQHVVDLRKKLRWFSRKHADKLVAAGRGEVWGEQIRLWVEYEFSSRSGAKKDARDHEQSPPRTSIVSAATDASALASATVSRLPVLTEPFVGDPKLAPTFDEDRYADLPPQAIALARGTKNGYVLELACDDHARRLLAGDRVLILQIPNSTAEIQLVESQNGLRLARQVKVIRALGIPLKSAAADGEWMALDTGARISDARPVAHAAGIVWARL